MEITKEQYEAYIKARESDKIPQWATYAISERSGLTYEDVREITNNLTKYEKQYGVQ